MAKQKTNIPSDETKEEKFRRVIDPRIKKTLRALDQVAGMPLQPTYNVSENDGKQVLAILKKSYDKLVDNYTRAIAGTLKAKKSKNT
ncbi:unnamed protein product, partial [marine sediment metagenome]